MTTLPQHSTYPGEAARPCRRSARVFCWPFAALVALAASAAPAAELVVVEQAGCAYCARFDAEIAPAWPNTEQGRRAPLRRVDLHGEWPADLVGVRRPELTPTFVLLDDGGHEAARLSGYPGDEHFWFLVDGMLERLAPAGDAPTGVAPADAASAGE